MTDQISDSTLGIEIFPEFNTLYDLIAPEVQGMTDEQLDWTSEEYDWAGWSIRNQISHMSSLIYRWLVSRWGDVLFPEGDHGVGDLEGIAHSQYDRRMDDDKYHDIPAILKTLDEGIKLAQRVLNERNVGFLQAHTVLQNQSPLWVLQIKAHPTGITPSGKPNEGVMTLEAAIRHIYFEETTHLFNIQRLKRAQGLSAVVEVPRVGYWVVDGWDISEAV